METQLEETRQINFKHQKTIERQEQEIADRDHLIRSLRQAMDNREVKHDHLQLRKGGRG
jgi:hypothetical protein